MIEANVCIIGAGPAGATAALQLAYMGIPCVIVDKAVFPRDKVCGDGLSGKVLTLLSRIDKGIGERLEQALFKANSQGISFIAPCRLGMDVTYPGPHGYVCKRIDFDNFLVEELRRCPTIRLFEGKNITRHRLLADGYYLSDQRGDFEIKAQLVIAANGAYSAFTKNVAGIHMEPEHYVAGIRAYYQHVKGLHPDHFIELHFLSKILPGYLWIFPLPDGQANVGIGMLSKTVRKKKVNLKKLLTDTLQQDPILKERFKNATLLDDIQGYGLPLGSKKRILYGERYMLAGDAGCLIDPFTGEGIGNALYSGRIAAQHAARAIAANDCSAAALAAYNEHIYRVLGPELQMSSRLQKLVKYPWLFNLLMKKAYHNSRLQELLSGMFNEIDLRKQLGQPLFYLKLLLNR